MPSKFFSRTGAFAWSPDGPHSTLPGLLVAGKCETANDETANTIDYFSDHDIFGNVTPKPSSSIVSNYRFYELNWARNNIVGGGNDNGQVVFFNALNVVNSSRLETISEKQVHQSKVRSISSSPSGKWFITSGSSSDLLLWDSSNLNTPYSPGQMEPNKQIKCVRWSFYHEVTFASVVSDYVNIWDLRQNGQPCLKLAHDITNSWETFSWSVGGEYEFFIGSAQGSLKKYDMRSLNEPIFEYARHSNGVYSISPNSKDPNLILSSGAEVFLWNKDENFTVETRRNDKARSVQWNPRDPNQFIIELENHPLQLCSLSNLGPTDPEAEHLKISKPSSPIVESLSFGAKKITLNRNSVEFGNMPIDKELFAEVQRFEEIKRDRKSLTDFVMDKALKIQPETEELKMKQLIWLMLAAQLEGASRNQILRYLDLIDDSKTKSIACSSVTTGSSVSSSCSSPTGERQNVTFLNGSIDTWQRLGESEWNMISDSIQGNHERIVADLCSRQEWMLASMYAFSNERNLMNHIFKAYAASQTQITNTADVIGKLCVDCHDEFSSAKIESFLKSFPDEKWKTMLGLFVTKVQSKEHLRDCMTTVAEVWIQQGKNLRALIPLIIAQNVELFLNTNKVFHDIEIFQQVSALKFASGQVTSGPMYEELAARYVGHLLDNGFNEMASCLMRQFDNVRNEKFVEMRHAVYETCGGEQFLNWQRPRNPYENCNYPFNPNVSRGSQAITEPLRMNPNHVPQAVQPIANPTPPSLSGWNDPPMLATCAKPTINRLGARYPQNLGYNNNNNVYNQNQYYGYNRY